MRLGILLQSYADYEKENSEFLLQQLEFRQTRLLSDFDLSIREGSRKDIIGVEKAGIAVLERPKCTDKSKTSVRAFTSHAVMLITCKHANQPTLLLLM